MITIMVLLLLLPVAVCLNMMISILAYSLTDKSALMYHDHSHHLDLLLVADLLQCA